MSVLQHKNLIRTNLFNYNPEYQGPRFYAFSSWGDDITQNYLTASMLKDSVVHPTHFLAFNFQNKTEDLIYTLETYYENKLAWIRDRYFINEDELITPADARDNYAPLSYLMDALNIHLGDEFLIENITEQNYNGAFVDILCTIPQAVSVQKVKKLGSSMGDDYEYGDGYLKYKFPVTIYYGISDQEPDMLTLEDLQSETIYLKKKPVGYQLIEMNINYQDIKDEDNKSIYVCVPTVLVEGVEDEQMMVGLALEDEYSKFLNMAYGLRPVIFKKQSSLKLPGYTCYQVLPNTVKWLPELGISVTLSYNVTDPNSYMNQISIPDWESEGTIPVYYGYWDGEGAPSKKDLILDTIEYSALSKPGVLKEIWKIIASSQSLHDICPSDCPYYESRQCPHPCSMLKHDNEGEPGDVIWVAIPDIFLEELDSYALIGPEDEYGNQFFSIEQQIKQVNGPWVDESHINDNWYNWSNYTLFKCTRNDIEYDQETELQFIYTVPEKLQPKHLLVGWDHVVQQNDKSLIPEYDYYSQYILKSMDESVTDLDYYYKMEYEPSDSDDTEFSFNVIIPLYQCGADAIEAKEMYALDTRAKTGFIPLGIWFNEPDVIGVPKRITMTTDLLKSRYQASWTLSISAQIKPYYASNHIPVRYDAANEIASTMNTFSGVIKKINDLEGMIERLQNMQIHNNPTEPSEPTTENTGGVSMKEYSKMEARVKTLENYIRLLRFGERWQGPSE